MRIPLWTRTPTAVGSTKQSADRGWLGIYLNDHLAMATGGTELARRAARGSSWHREALATIADELAADRSALKHIMQSLEVPTRSYKQAGAWAGEKVGRLKPNGRLISRSPVSDVLELEGLRIMVEGNAACWRLLRRLALAEGYDRLDRVLLDRLMEKAERQAKQLEELRISTAVEVFGGSSG